MRHILLTLSLWWSPALSWACGNAMVEAETQKSASYQTESVILAMFVVLGVTLGVAVWRRRHVTDPGLP